MGGLADWLSCRPGQARQHGAARRPEDPAKPEEVFTSRFILSLQKRVLRGAELDGLVAQADLVLHARLVRPVVRGLALGKHLPPRPQHILRRETPADVHQQYVLRSTLGFRNCNLTCTHV